jgi:small conductance mechanosensitive channel
VATWIKRVLVHRFERRIAGALPTDAATTKRARTLAAVLGAVGTLVIWLIVGIVALEESGVPVGPLLAAAGIGGIALGFGAQTLVRDLVAGFCILSENQFDVGDEIRVADVEGTVEAITLRTTVLRGLDGSRHVVSNGEIRVSSNRTKVFSRYVLVLPLPYDADLDRAVEVVRAAADELRGDPAFGADILGPLNVLGLDAFGEQRLDVKAYVETKPGRQWAVGRELRRRIKLALDREGIPLAAPTAQGGPAA